MATVPKPALVSRDANLTASHDPRGRGPALGAGTAEAVLIWQTPTEKATDIRLALSVYDDAVQGAMDTAYLLTADTDQAANAKLFARRFPGKKLVSVSPPGRTHSQHILSRTPHQIAPNREHIERALFPGLVTADGQASVIRPHEHDPPAGYVMWDHRPKPTPKSNAKATPPAAAMPER